MTLRLSRNHPILLKDKQNKITKMPPKGANLLEYSEQGRDILSKFSSAPLEGFATHSVDVSISEFMKNSNTAVEKGHDYLLWHLIYVEEFLQDIAENAIIDGGYDEGIDAYQVDSDEKRIRLFQSKYGSAHSTGAIDQFVQDVSRLKGKEQSKLKRDELQYLWKILNDEKMKVELVYITDQYVDDYNDKVRVMGRQQVYQTLWERIKKPAKGQNTSLRILKQPLEHKNCKVCVVSAFDLAELVEKNEHYIFESNIRKYSGGKGSINKKISATLEDDPQNFFEWNNGITITVDDVSIKNNELYLKGAQIVNGAQTSKSILDKKKKANNVDAEVLVTVIKTKDEDHQRKITKYRNSQNAVKGKDYVSLQDYFISIHHILAARHGYCFEHQQGFWLNLSTSEKAKFQGDEMYNKYLPDTKDRCKIKDDSAIASFVSYFVQKPNEVYGGIAKYLPNGAKYENVFNDELKTDHRYFLFPHLIREFAKNKLGYDRKSTQNKNKRYAQSLFVAVTARIIHKNILVKHDDFKDDIIELEKIMQNFGLCEKILGIADRVVTKFLEDSAVETKIEESNTAHNFFSNQVYGNDMLKIIDRKISQETEDISFIKKTIFVI